MSEYHVVLTEAPGEPIWRVPLEATGAHRALLVFSEEAAARAFWVDEQLGAIRVHRITLAQVARMALDSGADQVIVDPGGAAEVIAGARLAALAG